MSETERSRVTRVVQRDGRDVRLVQAYAIEVVAGPDAGRRVDVAGPLFRIGSHPSNDLALADPSVSKHHLEIAVSPDGYRLVDLGSSNGTLVGTMRIHGITVVEPVTLTLGATTLRMTPFASEVELPAANETRFGTLLGRSAVMRELFAQLGAVANSDAWVLVEGETGVGKEQLAESLHQASPRRAGPFIVVDCGALVGSLLESELFGHVRGAFTGAERERKGLLESADGGTLFLDEIAELAAPMQASLLGALGRKRVTPVGGTEAKPIDVRIIAATHRNLAREVNEGRFRADLFYRLAVVRLRVPPLRERLEDIPLLVEHFLAELRARGAERVPTELSAIVMARLAAERWPGNVRELRNFVERAASAGTGSAADDQVGASSALGTFAEARQHFLDDLGRRYFGELLERCGYNVSEAARRAGLERRHFARQLERYGIERPRAPGRNPP